MADLFPLETSIPIVNVQREKVQSVGPTDGLVSYTFLTRWNDLIQRVQAAPYRIGSPVSLANQNAAILATPLVAASLPQGLYRVSWYARITTAAGVSSSLTVTIGWTEGSQALTISGAAMTGNTVTTVQSGMLLLSIDDGSPITYATAYASNAAGAMEYELTVVVERVL